jgi:hypothetical protein
MVGKCSSKERDGPRTRSFTTHSWTLLLTYALLSTFIDDDEAEKVNYFLGETATAARSLLATQCPTAFFPSRA